MNTVITRQYVHRVSATVALFLLILLNYLTSFPVSSTPLANQVIAENQNGLAASTFYTTLALGLHDILTFDVYKEGEIIHILAGGNKSASGEGIFLHYTHSQDGGRQWTKPVAVSKQQIETIASRGNDIQLAVSGKQLIAVWQAKGEFPGTGPMASAYSLDSGKTWQQGPNPAGDNDGSQAYIDLIADQHGNFHAVWLEDPEEKGQQSLRYAHSSDGGRQWSQSITLDDSTCSCCANTLALSPQNELSILYRDMTPRDMSLMQSSDSGMVWRYVSVVGDFGWQFIGCPHVGGGLAYVQEKDAAQLHSVVWTGSKDKAGLYYLSSENNGQTWSRPVRLSETAMHGDITVQDSQKIFAVWNEMEAEGLSIFYSVSENGGTDWLSPKRLTSTDLAATHPKIVATSQGVLAIWTEKPSKQPGQLAWRMIN